ncbi:MAG: hypothetical protein ACKVP3_01740 [Hyphomicrobiaceae bacterium]
MHGAYGEEDNADTLLNTGRVPDNGEHWYVKAGIRHKWLPLGHAIAFGEYTEYLDQLGPAALAVGATGSEFTRWGASIVQEIDAAAMSIWLKYRRYEADIAAPAAANLSHIDDFDMLSLGGLINF